MKKMNISKWLILPLLPILMTGLLTRVQVQVNTVKTQQYLSIQQKQLNVLEDERGQITELAAKRDGRPITLEKK